MEVFQHYFGHDAFFAIGAWGVNLRVHTFFFARGMLYNSGMINCANLGRRVSQHSFDSLALLLLFLLCAARPAYAYVDPGSGFFVLQVIASVFAGLMFAVRRRIRLLVSEVVKVFSRSSTKS